MKPWQTVALWIVGVPVALLFASSLEKNTMALIMVSYAFVWALAKLSEIAKTLTRIADRLDDMRGLVSTTGTEAKASTAAVHSLHSMLANRLQVPPGAMDDDDD